MYNASWKKTIKNSYLWYKVLRKPIKKQIKNKSYIAFKGKYSKIYAHLHDKARFPYRETFITRIYLHVFLYIYI